MGERSFFKECRTACLYYIFGQISKIDLVVGRSSSENSVGVLFKCGSDHESVVRSEHTYVAWSSLATFICFLIQSTIQLPFLSCFFQMWGMASHQHIIRRHVLSFEKHAIMQSISKVYLVFANIARYYTLLYLIYRLKLTIMPSADQSLFVSPSLAADPADSELPLPSLLFLMSKPLSTSKVQSYVR